MEGEGAGHTCLALAVYDFVPDERVRDKGSERSDEVSSSGCIGCMAPAAIKPHMDSWPVSKAFSKDSA